MHVTLRLTVFEISAVKWQKNRYLRGQKWSTRAPLLTLHFVSPKDIATKAKGDKFVLGHSKLSRRSPRYPGPYKNYRHTKFNIDKTRTDVAFVG